jgi:DNA-binding NarL/FixJ family response regulator
LGSILSYTVHAAAERELYLDLRLWTPRRENVNKKSRVLVVDNQASTRQGIKALLDLVPDLEVLQEASNGWEAVQLVAEEQPDVVLMDVRMPVMDGLEATRKIKGLWPQVRVIVLTMYRSHKKEALAAGADHFLLKGGTSSTLTEVIRSLVVSPQTDGGGAKESGRISKASEGDEP